MQGVVVGGGLWGEQEGGKVESNVDRAIHAAGNLRQHEGPSTRNMCT